MEIFAILTFLIGIGGGVCAFVLPILILVGVGVFLYRRSKMRDTAKHAAQSWSNTLGTVISSTIQVKRTSNSRSEIPVVVYQYQVNGNAYTGQTIKAGEQFFNFRLMGDAQKAIARYPVGAQVMVYYNPANPAESALER
jgi:Protein of unknown function (DUF3592)